jgi:hypothetical protein
VSNFLLPIASHFAGERVACRFKAFADGAPLATSDDSQPIYEIPNGTSEVDRKQSRTPALGKITHRLHHSLDALR